MNFDYPVDWFRLDDSGELHAYLHPYVFTSLIQNNMPKQQYEIGICGIACNHAYVIHCGPGAIHLHPNLPENRIWMP